MGEGSKPNMKKLREIQNNLDVLKALVKREEEELMNLAQSSWEKLLKSKLEDQEEMIFLSFPSNFEVSSVIKLKRPNEWYVELEETFLPETHHNEIFWDLVREFKRANDVELNPTIKYKYDT